MEYFVILIVILAIYFAPTIVALNRDKRDSVAIFFLNLLLGWTLLGWVAALVWALTHDSTISPNY